MTDKVIWEPRVIDLSVVEHKENPPRKMDKDTLDQRVQLIYIDTGLSVPWVFEYDLDEGFAWQYVVGPDGLHEMEGREVRCRRLTGEFRAEWI